MTRTARGYEEEVFNCQITFLGDDLVEMYIPGHVLVENYGYRGSELYFVGVLSEGVVWCSWNARRGGCRCSGRNGLILVIGTQTTI